MVSTRDLVKLDDGTVARRCGAFAEHVDHVATRASHAGSSLRSTGSTRRWRQIRLYVLSRDGWRCQLLLDEHGQVVDAPRPSDPPAGPDDPAWLRAACQAHNLARGAAAGDSRSTETRPARAGRWEW